MSYFTDFFFEMFQKASGNFNWMVHEMNVTQWVIVAGIFVVSGFMALKTKI